MICFDTMILIWGIQGESRPDQARMIELAKRYIDSLKPKEIIMVPSVVLAEYLQGFKEEKDRQQQLSILRNRFFIPAFDLHAAALAAEISATTGAAIIEELEKQRGRRAVKADIQIIATAITQGAEAIITANVKEFEKLAAGRIKIAEVPETYVQTGLDLMAPAETPLAAPPDSTIQTRDPASAAESMTAASPLPAPESPALPSSPPVVPASPPQPEAGFRVPPPGTEPPSK